MSVTTGTTGTCCRTVQFALADIAGANDTTYRIDAPGTLSAVRSAENISGFRQIDFQDPNSTNIIYQIGPYFQNPRTPATDSAVNICTTGTTTGQKFANVSLDKTSSVQETLDEAEFANFCNSYDANGNSIADSTFARALIKAKVQELLVKVNRNLTDYIVANTGNFRGGTTGPRQITMLNSAGGVLAPAASGEIEIENSYEDLESPGPYFAIGSGNLRTYAKYARIACCNNGGVDLTKLDSNMRFYRDPYVDTAFGTDNNVLTLKPGAVQLFTVQNFVGPIQTFGYDFQKTNVIVEWMGPNGQMLRLPVDFAAFYDKCGASGTGKSKWVLTWIARYGFYTIPSDVEASGSPFEGVNGVLHFVANCGTESCADINS